MKYLILILGLCFYIQIQAQQKSESQRPPWMRGDLPIQTNHTATGSNKCTAKEKHYRKQGKMQHWLYWGI